MKKIITFCCCLMAFVTCFGQDLIVTQEKDSVNCIITKENNGFIYFTFKHNGEIRNTLLSKDQVLYYQKGFFQESEVPADYKAKMKKIYPKWRVAISGGYSYRTARISDELGPDYHDYLRGLKNGYHLSAEVDYFFKSAIGVGATYIYSHAASSGKFLFENEAGEQVSDYLSDNVNLHYIGPTFTTRLLNQKQTNAFIATFSLGYLRYVNHASIAMVPLKLTGETIGFLLGIGYDIGIAKNTAIGLQISLMGGSLKKEKMYINDAYQGDISTEEGLGRIDLSIGLRFGKRR